MYVNITECCASVVLFCICIIGYKIPTAHAPELNLDEPILWSQNSDLVS